MDYETIIKAMKTGIKSLEDHQRRICTEMNKLEEEHEATEDQLSHLHAAVEAFEDR